jgi:diguanylate cyclase (GGDEF)-like protein
MQSRAATHPPARGPDATAHARALLAPIHRVRSVGSVLGLLMLGAHLQAQAAGPWLWGLLLAHMLLYPPLLHAWVMRAANPLHAGLHAFWLDALLLGLWAGGLGYPLWITFALGISNLVSVMLYRGPRATAVAAALFVLPGLLLWWLNWQGAPPPHTTALTTALAALGLAVFLLLVARLNHRRTLKLHDTREALRHSARAQQDLNEVLRAQLHANRTLQEQLSEQAHRDALTGLYNRRYLDATLQRELARCARESLPLSLVLLDLDHFKHINDRWGHPVGDAVLRQLAARLTAQARLADVACRYGGEEFLMLLPGMPAEVALLRAEGWRADFAADALRHGSETIPVTLSAGVATYPQDGITAQALIGAADQALYRAKTSGRNRVVAHVRRGSGPGES